MIIKWWPDSEAMDKETLKNPSFLVQIFLSLKWDTTHHSHFRKERRIFS
jgi:hypothetical protein